MRLEGDALAAWLRQRAGKLTASRMGVALDFLKNGNPSKARSDYMRELIAERLTGDSVRHFVNDAMVWGIEKEGDAKDAYQAETGEFILETSFYDHPRIDNFGATPDGLLDGNGLIEIKCPTTTTYIGWVMAGCVPPEHEPQMCAQMLCTGRKWCEFVAYDPRIRDPKRQLFIRRYEPTAERLAEIETAAEKFLGEVDHLFQLFVETAA